MMHYLLWALLSSFLTVLVQFLAAVPLLVHTKKVDTALKFCGGLTGFMDAVIGCWGIYLVFFSGPNKDYCEPEVWWTAAMQATLALFIFSLFLAIACCSSVCMAGSMAVREVRHWQEDRQQ